MTSLVEAGAAGILPPEYSQQVIIEPLSKASVVFNPSVLTQLATNAEVFHLPDVSADVTPVWASELDDLTADAPTMGDNSLSMLKLGAAVLLSNEVIADASVSAMQVVSTSIFRGLQRALDAAVCANTTSKAPSGLQSLSPTSLGTSGAAISNLDLMHQAEADAYDAGHPITSWVMNSAVWTELLALKRSSGSGASGDVNVDLIGADPSIASPLAIDGIPVVRVPGTHLPAHTVWGVASDLNFNVLRNGVEVAFSPHASFVNDATAVRVTLRLGWKFLLGSSVYKIFTG